MTEVKKPLLRQNGELRKDRIWNWTLPAFAVRLTDGRTMNVCPKAGACANFCYALNGTYMFRNVKAAHERNLLMVLDERETWKSRMISELLHKRFSKNFLERFPDQDLQLDEWTEAWRVGGGAAVRIHDSGDFFSLDYLNDWLDIARKCPHVLFYAYTKEVSMFREHVAGKAPVNFRWVYSTGGKEDSLIDKDTERHADVFPSMEAMEAAGYMSQEENDLLCVLLPTTRVGIVANNIVHFNKKMAGRTFSELQVSKEKLTEAKRQKFSSGVSSE
jgi:hypothetical protein